MPDLGIDTEGFAVWLSANLLLLVVLLVGALIVLRVGRGMIRRLLHRTLLRGALQAGIPPELAEPEVEKRSKTLETLMVTILRWIVIAVVILILLAVFDLVGVIAALGLVLAALAFAGQDVIRDYLNGMLIILENQFAEGDVVRIAGVSGTVEVVSLRRTQLRDLDGAVHIVPNGEIRVASNLTRLHAGINLDVSVAYGTDVDRAMVVINDVGSAMAADPDWTSRILEAPASLRVNELGDSGVDIKVTGRVLPGEQWAATGELRRRILIAFAEEGIEIPFPHRVVISRTDAGDAAIAAGLVGDEAGSSGD
jgi:moderate conductance mechanosensitive channel